MRKQSSHSQSCSLSWNVERRDDHPFFLFTQTQQAPLFLCHHRFTVAINYFSGEICCNTSEDSNVGLSQSSKYPKVKDVMSKYFFGKHESNPWEQNVTKKPFIRSNLAFFFLFQFEQWLFYFWIRLQLTEVNQHIYKLWENEETKLRLTELLIILECGKAW